MPRKAIPQNTSNQPLKADNLIIADIQVRSADRSPKDVANWRNALTAAESVHYPNRTRLFDLYDDVTLDGHLTGIMHKRMATVRNKTISFVDAKGAAVEALEPLLKSEAFRQVISTILETPAFGCSGMEFVPGPELAIVPIPRRHIKPEFGVIALEQSQYTGIDYTKVPSLWVLGQPRDLGYLLKCSYYTLLKKGAFADWAQYIEIFGQPVRIIKYDAYDNKTKVELRQVLDESGSSLALMIPKQADFEMMDGKGSNGDGQLQERFKAACNDEMSIIVLGNTETTSSHSGSGYAQSQEHGRQQLEIIKDDMAYLLNALNSAQFMAILASYNLPVQGGRFQFDKELDLAMLTQKVNIDIQVATKVPIADDYWYDTYGIPKPDNYQQLKAEMEAKNKVEVEGEVKVEDKGKVKGKVEDKGKLDLGLDLDLDPDLNLKPSAWHRLRHKLADFFDPAHTD